MSVQRVTPRTPTRPGGGVLLLLACTGLVTNAVLVLLLGAALSVVWPAVIAVAVVLLIVLSARGHRRLRRQHRNRRQPRRPQRPRRQQPRQRRR